MHAAAWPPPTKSIAVAAAERTGDNVDCWPAHRILRSPSHSLGARGRGTTFRFVQARHARLTLATRCAVVFFFFFIDRFSVRFFSLLVFVVRDYRGPVHRASNSRFTCVFRARATSRQRRKRGPVTFFLRGIRGLSACRPNADDCFPRVTAANLHDRQKFHSVSRAKSNFVPRISFSSYLCGTCGEWGGGAFFSSDTVAVSVFEELKSFQNCIDSRFMCTHKMVPSGETKLLLCLYDIIATPRQVHP